jgi:predicted ATP-grasp superfamily ATP-dependent carboligase
MKASILTNQGRAYAVFQNVGVLLLLLFLLPFNLLLVFFALIYNFIKKQQKRSLSDHPKNILVTGAKMAKSLQLARLFYAAGNRVILIETEKYWLSGSRFSNTISKFYTVPDPQKNWDAYCKKMLHIIQKEKIDVFVPVTSPVGSYYESLLKPHISKYCEVVHFDVQITQMLDSKFEFIEKAKSIGLSVPGSFLVTKPETVLDFDFTAENRQYILKSIPYDSVHRLDMTKLPMKSKSEMVKFVESLPISKEKPWAMQEFITGKEYCTHSTVRKGKIRLHVCCESSEFQLNYEHVENKKIYEWVREFVEQFDITGQVSFDFIQAKDGTVYPIECNPRTHTAITTFYNHPDAADAYLKDSQNENEMPVTPLPDSKPTYWTYYELWKLTKVRTFDDLKVWIRTIVYGTDGVFQIKDPLPFLMVPHWQIFLLVLGNLKKLKGWVRIDFNIGKLVEQGGD